MKAKEADEKKAQAKAKAKARTTAKAKAKTTSTKTIAKAKADSEKAFIPACIVNSDPPVHITRVLHEGAEDWNMGGYQSARSPKRRKFHAVDEELEDPDIDPFLAQIVTILKHCFMSMS